MVTQEVGSQGFTDEIEKRLDKIAHLLAVQQTKSRSKRLLLSLFQTFAHVRRERATYLAQLSSETKTCSVAWADGFLVATLAAINLYLGKRFSTNSISFDEAEMLVERPSLREILDLERRRHDTDEKNAPATTPGRGSDPGPGIREVGDVLEERTDIDS